MSHLSRGVFAPYPVDPSDIAPSISGGFQVLGQRGTTAGAVSNASRYYCVPFVPKFSQPIASVGFVVTVGGGVVATAKAAVVATNLATLRPTGTALTSNNTGVSVTGTGVISVPVTATQLQRGVPHFAVVVFTWDTTAPTVSQFDLFAPGNANILGLGMQSSGSYSAFVYFAGTYTNDIAAIDFGAQTYTTSAANGPILQVGY